ncbi:MAG: glycosyltransferase family 2 protein [Bacteroidaceae bacterium]|nr:glycosyltransferase family 2 protein [Bacteroidaceae bacterium]
MKKIAVVILNWNGADMLSRFLPSVVKFSHADADIFVADNGSTDNSCELVERDFPTVQLIRLPENFGFAEGYNQALQQLDYEYFLLLNSDVEVTPGWLQPMLAYMEQHGEVAACQPKLMDWKRKTDFEYAGAAGGFIDRYGYPFCRGRIFDRIETDEAQYDAVVPLFWASGAALMVRRHDWQAVGGLDGRFFAHMEEIDFCWRLRLRGRTIVCIAESKVYHVGGATLAKENPRKTFLNFRNNLLMLYKNLPERELSSVMRIRCLLDWVAAAKFLLTDGRENAKAVFAARREFKKMQPDYVSIRKENLRNAIVQDIPERMPASLLIQYYLFGHKTFSSLVHLITGCKV